MDTKTLVPFDVVHINHQRILDLFHKGTVEDICKEIELHYMVLDYDSDIFLGSRCSRRSDRCEGWSDA